jgi:hypothetical protein
MLDEGERLSDVAPPSSPSPLFESTDTPPGTEVDPTQIEEAEQLGAPQELAQSEAAEGKEAEAVPPKIVEEEEEEGAKEEPDVAPSSSPSPLFESKDTPPGTEVDPTKIEAAEHLGAPRELAQSEAAEGKGAEAVPPKIVEEEQVEVGKEEQEEESARVKEEGAEKDGAARDKKAVEEATSSVNKAVEKNKEAGIGAEEGAAPHALMPELTPIVPREGGGGGEGGHASGSGSSPSSPSALLRPLSLSALQAAATAPDAGVASDKGADTTCEEMAMSESLMFTSPVALSGTDGGVQVYSPLDAQVAVRNAAQPRARLNKLQSVKVASKVAQALIKPNQVAVAPPKPTLASDAMFDIHWNRREHADRVCKAFRVNCTDEFASVVNALDLDKWFVENQNFHGGLQGIIQIIGNSDTLERAIRLAHAIEEALTLDPGLDEESKMKMREDFVPDNGEKVAMGLSSKISAHEAESRLNMMFSRGIVRGGAFLPSSEGLELCCCV